MEVARLQVILLGVADFDPVPFPDSFHAHVLLAAVSMSACSLSAAVGDVVTYSSFSMTVGSVSPCALLGLRKITFAFCSPR